MSDKDYYCIYDPEAEHYLGYGINVYGRLLFAWLSEDSPLYDDICPKHDIASFAGPVGSSVDDLVAKVREAFAAKNFPDPETLRGCVLVSVDLDESLSVSQINHDGAIIVGKFDE